MVQIFTPFFDENRCFEECKNLDITVAGSWFPASIFGRFKALCAYLRMLFCTLYVILFAGNFTYYMLDQVSFPIPCLRCRNRKVLFYCHYPDKLLSTNRRGCLVRLYRLVLDWIEEKTTGMAMTILVNSKFTLQVFKDSFVSLRNVEP